MKRSFLIAFVLTIAAVSMGIAQPRYEVRLQQEPLQKELLVTVQVRATEMFGLGDAVYAIRYDSLKYHRAELVSAEVFGKAPYREIELHYVSDTLYLGTFYNYRRNPGQGATVATSWTTIATLRFPMKTKSAPLCMLLREATSILRDNGEELEYARE
jgi:hypothetical protein